MARKVLVGWSGGKDSALALGRLLKCPAFQVVGLLTTLREDSVVAMHEVPEALIEDQAKAAGIPLWVCETSPSRPYEQAMLETFEEARAEGVECVAYGDLFLEDIRAYRLRLHEGTGITAQFPLFGEDTAALPPRLFSEGYEAVITSVDVNRLPPELCGRSYDASFLRDLPKGADPCGERGEFHSFVFNAPYFSRQVPYAVSGFRDLRFDDESHPFACRVCDLRST